MSALESFTSGAPERVDVAAIDRELTRLWKEAAEAKPGETAPVTRACFSNLIVWTAGGRAADLDAVVAKVVEAHPARVLMIEIDPSASGDSIEAFISAHCHRPAPGARQVCCEQVTIRAAGGAPAHAPGLVASLLLPALPVSLWIAGDLAAGDPVFERLVDLSDAVVVDSAHGSSDLGLLAAFARSRERTVVHDLNWRRLLPVQEAVASIFDAPLSREAIPRIDRAEITAGPGGEAASRLLGGWLRATLGKDRLPVALRSDARSRRLLRSIVLRASGPPAPVEFEVDTEDAAESIRACVRAQGPCPPSHRLRWRDRDLARLLGDTLERPGRDLLFESSLARAPLQPLSN